jgi:hypothetical protein
MSSKSFCTEHILLENLSTYRFVEMGFISGICCGFGMRKSGIELFHHTVLDGLLLYVSVTCPIQNFK